jgi:hypothetical protein
LYYCPVQQVRKSIPGIFFHGKRVLNHKFVKIQKPQIFLITGYFWVCNVYARPLAWAWFFLAGPSLNSKKPRHSPLTMLRQIARNSIQQTRRISLLKTSARKITQFALFQKPFVPISPGIAIRQFSSTGIQFNDHASYTIT